jgi:hypothetical protein
MIQKETIFHSFHAMIKISHPGTPAISALNTFVSNSISTSFSLLIKLIYSASSNEVMSKPHWTLRKQFKDPA